MSIDLNPNETNYKLILKSKWKSIYVKKNQYKLKKIDDTDLDLKT